MDIPTDHPCLDSYIGETEQTLKARLIKHGRPNTTYSSAIPKGDKSFK